MNSLDSLKISIIVPVYNVKNELGRCIESLLGQSYNNTEILIVDDGSTDGSSEMCDYYQTVSDKITVFHKENGGLSDARNYGFLRATGDYILFVDSDDYIDLKTCEQFVAIINKYKKHLDIIVGDALMIKGDAKIPMTHTCLRAGQLYNFETLAKLAISANQWYAPAWLNLYRREFLHNNNLFFAKGLLHEDMEFLPRAFMCANKIGYLGKIFYYYIIRNSSIITTKTREKNGATLMQIYSQWKKEFDNISNECLKKLLYGYLIKNYLHTCRELKISNNNAVFSLKAPFIIKYSLNAKERIKAIISLVLLISFPKIGG